ncbi:MAG: AbrB/MazE/SpoVT family DNA-binding domain-containing protein [Lentisphaeria bacterium]|nr:AbrB/MazE/SpoVT family DNA-binding domain-containing protein [Lentisphaeria bacterium]
MDIAKVVTSGHSQVVRIPRKFRFKASQVKISRKGNQIILSPVSQEDKLNAFLAVPPCPDFKIERDSVQNT